MDLALEGVHVLVTGTLLFQVRPSKSTAKCYIYPGASGGIGLETVRLFLGRLPRYRSDMTQERAINSNFEK